MAALSEGFELRDPAVPAVDVDEAAARRALRRQIGDLERKLGETFVSAFPRTAVDVRVAHGVPGPRVLSLGDLESHRDALQARLRDARLALERRGVREERNRVQLEKMLLQPERYKFAKLANADLGEGGCGVWQVKPRLGIIGMLAGWWHVKLSSGCPLAT
jgi:hypothetical protein